MQLLVVVIITLSILGFGANINVRAIRCYEKVSSLSPQTETVCGEGSNVCKIELDKNGFGQTRVVARGCTKKNSFMDSNGYYGENGYQPGCWKKKTRPGTPDEVGCLCEGDLCNGENDLVVLTGLFADTLNNKRPILASPLAPVLAPATPAPVAAVTPAPTAAVPKGPGGSGSKLTFDFFLFGLTICVAMTAGIF